MIISYINPLSSISKTFSGYWRHVLVAAAILMAGFFINSNQESVYKEALSNYGRTMGTYNPDMAYKASSYWAYTGLALWAIGFWLITWHNHVYTRANKIGTSLVALNWIIAALMLLGIYGANTGHDAVWARRIFTVSDIAPANLFYSAVILFLGFLLSKGIDVRPSRILSIFKAEPR